MLKKLRAESCRESGAEGAADGAKTPAPRGEEGRHEHSNGVPQLTRGSDAPHPRGARGAEPGRPASPATLPWAKTRSCSA